MELQFYLLRALRQRKITQQDFAKSVGIDSARMSRIVNGKELVDEQELSKFADALDMTVEELTGEPLSFDTSLEEIREKMMQLPQWPMNYYGYRGHREVCLVAFSILDELRAIHKLLESC